jgi:hypothetical protein
MFVIHIGSIVQRITDLIEIAAPRILEQNQVQLVLTKPSVELLIGLDDGIHNDANDDDSDDVVSWKDSIPNCDPPKSIVQ